MGTAQIENFKKMGMTEEEYSNPETCANIVTAIWENSGTNRKIAVAVCKSAKGLYHLHFAATSNPTTLKHVANVFGGSHIEPQLGSKKQLTEYITKTGKYAEKGEEVLYVIGLENIQDVQGRRTELNKIESLIKEGLTPQQIFEESFAYRRYSRMIKEEYIARRVKMTPVIKDMVCEWHIGESGSGKTYYYKQLCDEIGADQIYFCTDFQNGGLDRYIEEGAPPVLILDEFKGNMPFSQLLVMLDKYGRSQIHSRYTNAVCLWTRVIITSVYPPEAAYRMMVEESSRSVDSVKQLLRRLTTIVYHEKLDTGEYKTYEMPAEQYTTYAALITAARQSWGVDDTSDTEMATFRKILYCGNTEPYHEPRETPEWARKDNDDERNTEAIGDGSTYDSDFGLEFEDY